MPNSISTINIRSALGEHLFQVNFDSIQEKINFLALHLLKRSITRPSQPGMADGLQMRGIFLAGFWQVCGVLNAQARGRGLNHDAVLSAVQRRRPQQIRKVLLGCSPTSDEEGFILAAIAG